ncbi:FecR domain-containing protein [Bordetella sp. BOR01]|uniref:FecR domain-containing protein n=1 Tax=Bordetella sp. BOR01 TaxID=2854779 RepID=UPI001C455B07|nr:FecR domain-containing protein [Bordetella sp. BOR01]MBV7485247.1 FecR domain-containing protein [Bordetella sp. BOR01]
MLSRFIRIFITLSAAASGTLASAQPAGALGDDFIYRIRQGDTLIRLAGTYTRNESNWATLQRLNSVDDPYRLVIGSELRIPLALIPEIPAQARAVHVSGSASMDGTPLRVGMPVAEGSTITTSANGFVTLQLADGSKVTLPQEGATHLERLRQFEGEALTDSVLRVERGVVDSHVAPSGQGVGRFEVRTPVAVTGVRGTRFRVQAHVQGARSEVIDGSVRLQPHAPDNAPGRAVAVATGFGAAVGADGVLSGIRPLLPAPQLGAPQRAGSGQWTAAVSSVPGAVAYQVQVSRDAEGLELTSSSRFNSTDIRFSAPGSGTYHVAVRAIDEAGLQGRDARLTFEGTNILMTVSGLPVSLSDGGAVTLADY